MRKLYVLSKQVENERYLIGELSEENGEYTFEYRLGGELPRWYLLLDEYFPNINRVYKGKEVEKFIRQFVPAADDKYASELAEDAGLKKYDEWEMLKFYGSFDPRQRAYFFEKLPKGLTNT